MAFKDYDQESRRVMTEDRLRQATGIDRAREALLQFITADASKRRDPEGVTLEVDGNGDITISALGKTIRGIFEYVRTGDNFAGRFVFYIIEVNPIGEKKTHAVSSIEFDQHWRLRYGTEDDWQGEVKEVASAPWTQRSRILGNVLVGMFEKLGQIKE